jgi:pantoate--beta-alanine ligase
VTVLSIFVNPLQFGVNEDLARYPRDEAADLKLAEDAGVDVVFLPSVEDMYPEGHATRIDVGALAEVVEGASRPGHFEGVATVVAQLFNLVRPHVAFFGQKDAQQVAVVKKMVADLSMPVEVEVGATVREPDGLALSSRNVYLSDAERKQALALSRALVEGEALLKGGGDPESVEKKMWEVLTSYDGVSVDYARAVHPATFGDADGYPVLLVIAARVGATRLIDNLLVDR